MAALSRWRIGFDIGGTFTDFILLDTTTNAVRLHKRLTTPEDPSVAALAGLEELTAEAGIRLADVGEMIHGTTLVTNAIIERKGAKVGFITTEGLRDLIEMGTEQRYDVYDLFLKFPDTIVPRRRRMTVPERLDSRGLVRTPLDLDALRQVVETLVSDGVDAIAIGFLHAYRNANHERAAGDLIRREFPGIAVSLSSDVVNEMWEYQRFVTTCANAFVQPLMDRYLDRLTGDLAMRGFCGALRLMHSAGGLVSPETARSFPIRLLESGPAGGGLATAFFGALAGKSDVISFDMGGTTAKGCLIEGGRADIAPMMEAGRVHRFRKGSGVPIKAPVIDMIEIGGGGGSIAWIDDVGLLQVGPHSAGSAPGPACYGLGGTKPTVTDANLVLGYYDPGFFNGGRMTLDVEAARVAIATVATPLGLSIEAAALGIRKVVSENMAAAIRVHLVEKSKDPRRYSMVSFGGAGPAHGAAVARILGIEEVIVPPASGAASALGFLAAPISFETVRSATIELKDGFDSQGLNEVLAELEAIGRAQLSEAGVVADEVRVLRRADMRFIGQMHEISVPLPDHALDEAGLPALKRGFETAYAARYMAVPPGSRLEATNIRVLCEGPTPELAVAGLAGERATERIKGRRSIWMDEAGFVDAVVYDRYALRDGDAIKGPAIIEEREATTLVPPGDQVRIDRKLNIRIQIGTGSAKSSDQSLAVTALDEDAAIEADPIGLEIMWSRLVTIAEEMWLTVCRTAFSLIISEAQDFACELLDQDGETLAHSARGMPVFNLTLPRAVKALLKAYPPETLKPGDVLVTNDPWLCAGHLPDIAVVTPVFHAGRLVALMGTVGHVSDIGGTKDSLSAREIYDEGFQIPPLKLIEAGVPNATLFTLLGQNVRGGEQVVGDFMAFVSANAIGGRRLAAFMEEYGFKDLRALSRIVQNRSERAMRAAITAIPDGTYHAETTTNPLGVPYSLPLALTVEGDRIILDFAGAPPAQPRGGLNCTFSYTEAHATYPLKCILTPGVRGNAGCYRPFEVRAPEGSVLNVDRGASVNVRTRTGWYIGPSVYKALSTVAPDKVQAFTGLPMSLSVYGKAADGTGFSDVFLMGGGQGASAHDDGRSGLIFPSSAANTSIELFETRVPVVVVEKSFVADTGGPGEYRGGLAQRFVIAKRDEGGQLFVSVYPESVGSPKDGLFGGAPGAESSGRILDSAGQLVRDCGTGALVELTSTDHRLEARLTGGSGFGLPARRQPGRVAADIADGTVTREQAARDYGASAIAAFAEPVS